jgi:hypothetical protein
MPELSSARRMVQSLAPVLRGLRSIVGKTPTGKSAPDQRQKLEAIKSSLQELEASYNIAMASIYMGLARQDLKGFMVGARLTEAERAASDHMAEGRRWLGKLGSPSANWDVWTTYNREDVRIADDMARQRKKAAEFPVPVYVN